MNQSDFAGERWKHESNIDKAHELMRANGLRLIELAARLKNGADLEWICRELACEEGVEQNVLRAWDALHEILWVEAGGRLE